MTTRKKIAKKLAAQASSARVNQLREQLTRAGKLNIMFFDSLQFLVNTLKSLLLEEYDRIIVRQGRKILVDETVYIKDIQASLNDLLKDGKEAQLVQYIQETYLLPEHEKVKNSKSEGVLAGMLNAIRQRDELTFDKLGTSAFFITNFATATKLKNSIVTYILKDNLKLSEEVVKYIASKIDRGHGAGKGLSISYTAAAEKLSTLQLNTAQQEILREYIIQELTISKINLEPDDLQDIEKLIFEWDSIINPKTARLSSNYIPYIYLQDWRTNQAVDAQREKQVLKLIREITSSTLTPKILLESTGSPSLKDQMISVAIEPIFDIEVNSRRVSKKVKLESKYKLRGSKLKSQDTETETINKRASTSNIVPNKPRKAQKPRIKSGISVKNLIQQPAFNQLQLVGILNASLPPVVRKNMQYPALQNRTGLFSESVKVTSIDQTPKGFPSISYTYDKIPYQVFEMGIGESPWATPERDPRKLIDKSVRELAAEYIGQRFYTKRV